MRKKYVIDSGRTLSIQVVWAGILIAVLLLPGLASAAGEKTGHKLTLTLKNGSLVQGELLTVLENRLILFNANSSTGAEIQIGEVALIRVHKKTNAPKGFGLGFLIGGAGGALLGILSGDDMSGFFRFSAGEKAVAGALVCGLLGTLAGGLIGSLEGIKESIDLVMMPPPALDHVLDKLKSYARVPGNIPPGITIVTTPAAVEGFRPDDEKAEPESARPIPTKKYEHLHFGLGRGFFRSRSVSQLKNLIKGIGFAETITTDFLIFSYPSVYPEVKNNREIPDVFIEYSLSPRFALGLLYAPLGDYTISGCREIPSHSFGIAAFPTFTGSFKGEMVFLTASLYPLPEAFSKKTRLKLTAGVGNGKMKMEFRGSELFPLNQYPLFLNINNYKSFSKRIEGAFLSAELVHFIGRHWSFGIEAGYRYEAFKVEGFSIDCLYHFDAPNSSGGFLIFETQRVDVPGRTYNFGGFEAGAKMRIHF